MQWPVGAPGGEPGGGFSPQPSSPHVPTPPGSPRRWGARGTFAGGESPLGDLGGWESSPDRGADPQGGVGDNGLTAQNVAMLQDAFTTLSLKDKCLIRSGLSAVLGQPLAHGLAENLRDPLGSLDADTVESEVASAITESDVESLDMAMAMMGPDEIAELEKEARVLQKNMKAWIM